MTTGESAVEKPCADTTVLRFKIDGLQHTAEQMWLKVSALPEAVSAAALKGVKVAMESMGMRDPGRGPKDFASEDEERIVVSVRAFEDLMRRAGHGPSHGSVNGSPKSWLRDAVIWVTLALSAWTLKTVIDQGKDITRMQCQLSPTTCQQVVVPRGP